MKPVAALVLPLLVCVTAVAASVPATNEELAAQVRATEIAFAKSMANRDHAAFVSFLSEETVFFSGPTPLHGKQKVADFWRRFYERPAAPFKWEPDEVEVLDSGKLALTSGPVHTPDGKLISRFTSVWRLEAPGVWRIVFDKGSPVCDCAEQK